MRQTQWRHRCAVGYHHRECGWRYSGTRLGIALPAQPGPSSTLKPPWDQNRARQPRSCPSSYRLVSFFCTKTLYSTAASFSPRVYSVLSALETPSCLCHLCLYWEFLLGIPPLGILPPDFKGRGIIMPFINIGFSVMTFRPLSRQAGRHMFNIKHISSPYSHAASQKCSLAPDSGSSWAPTLQPGSRAGGKVALKPFIAVVPSLAEQFRLLRRVLGPLGSRGTTRWAVTMPPFRAA